MKERIERFLQARPAITFYELCKEAGASYNGWYKIMKGQRRLTEHYRKEFPAMYDVMKKYGYQERK